MSPRCGANLDRSSAEDATRSLSRAANEPYVGGPIESALDARVPLLHLLASTFSPQDCPCRDRRRQRCRMIDGENNRVIPGACRGWSGHAVALAGVQDITTGIALLHWRDHRLALLRSHGLAIAIDGHHDRDRIVDQPRMAEMIAAGTLPRSRVTHGVNVGVHSRASAPDRSTTRADTTAHPSDANCATGPVQPITPARIEYRSPVQPLTRSPATAIDRDHKGDHLRPRCLQIAGDRDTALACTVQQSRLPC